MNLKFGFHSILGNLKMHTENETKIINRNNKMYKT